MGRRVVVSPFRPSKPEEWERRYKESWVDRWERLFGVRPNMKSSQGNRPCTAKNGVLSHALKKEAERKDPDYEYSPVTGKKRKRRKCKSKLDKRNRKRRRELDPDEWRKCIEQNDDQVQLVRGLRRRPPKRSNRRSKS